MQGKVNNIRLVISLLALVLVGYWVFSAQNQQQVSSELYSYSEQTFSTESSENIADLPNALVKADVKAPSLSKLIEFDGEFIFLPSPGLFDRQILQASLPVSKLYFNTRLSLRRDSRDLLYQLQGQPFI